MGGVITIVVTYNRSDILQKALDCIEQQDFPVAEIVVVDNNSSDDTPEVLKLRKKNNSGIHVIRSDENVGFGGGLQRGMTWVLENRNPDYMWLMDDDSFPEPDALSWLLKHVSTGNYHLLGFSGYKMNWFSKRTANPETHTGDIDFILVDNAIVSFDAAKKAGVVSGTFFMMCEDLEYCLRLRQHGFMIGVLKNHHVRRLNMGSQRFSRATLWRGYYHSRNHLIILKRYFTAKRLVHYITLQFKYLIACFTPRDRWTRIRFRIKGVWHGVKGKTGKTLDPVTLKFGKSISQ